MGDTVKSGYVKRYSKSFLSGGWNQVFLTYHKDTRLNMYKKQGEYSAQLTICMKDVCKYFAYGEFTNGMPGRPDIPSGSSIKCLMGIPTQPSSKSKIIWFLFCSEGELHEWMTAITSILPPPPKKEHGGAPHHHQPQNAQPVGSAPYPAMPSGPPPPAMHGVPPPHAGVPPAPGGLGFENLSLGPNPAPPAYQPYPTAAPGYPAAPPPQGYPAHPPQGYPGAAPPHAAYPTQPYQQYPASPYGAPPGGAHYPPPPAHYSNQGHVVSYPQQGYHQPHGQGYPTTVVYQQQPVHVVHHKKKGGLGSTGQMAAGLAGGALLGYGASRMMGGGWGLGRWGSWSSLSSFGSCGSFGSFSSFGSFD